MRRGVGWLIAWALAFGLLFAATCIVPWIVETRQVDAAQASDLEAIVAAQPPIESTEPAVTHQVTSATAPAPAPASRCTDVDLEVLAKAVWGEARALPPEEQALVIWTAFDRVDSGRWGDTVYDVVTAPHQFQGYRAKNPITPEILTLCQAEAVKWTAGDSAPALAPYAMQSGYLFFTGDGRHNYFR
jgi:hypothetical protein